MFTKDILRCLKPKCQIELFSQNILLWNCSVLWWSYFFLSLLPFRRYEWFSEGLFLVSENPYVTGSSFMTSLRESLFGNSYCPVPGVQSWCKAIKANGKLFQVAFSLMLSKYALEMSWNRFQFEMTRNHNRNNFFSGDHGLTFGFA